MVMFLFCKNAKKWQNPQKRAQYNFLLTFIDICLQKIRKNPEKLYKIYIKYIAIKLLLTNVDKKIRKNPQ